MPIPDLDKTEEQILSLLSQEYRKLYRPVILYRKTLIDQIKPTNFLEFDTTVLNLDSLGYLAISNTMGSANWNKSMETPNYSVSMTAEQYVEYEIYVERWDEEFQKMIDLLLLIEEYLQIEGNRREVINFCKSKKLAIDDIGYLLFSLRQLGYLKTYGYDISELQLYHISAPGAELLRAYKKQMNFEKMFGFLTQISDGISHLVIREYQTLSFFKQKKLWKYCVIVAGSIIESLLAYYVEQHTSCGIDLIKPNSKRKEEKSFNELLTEAEDKNLFDIKRDWRFIKDHIKDFRNYIHLRKEIKEGYSVDESIYLGIEPILHKVIETFSKNW
jgi:hypothetical protein